MKIIKLIIINTLILLILSFIGTELFYIHKYQTQHYFKPEFKIENYYNLLFHPISTEDYFNRLYERKRLGNVTTPFFRNDYNVTSDKKPILFLGDSYTWGEELEEEETVSAQFAKLTKRPTFNRGGKGWGFSQLLYQLRDKKIYEQIPEPEYIIYTFISDHFYRIYKFKENPVTINFQPKYSLNKQNQLIEEKPHFWDSFLSISDFQYYYGYRFKSDNESNKIAKIYLLSAKEEFQKNWKNTKFVILKYPSGFDDRHLDSPIFKELEQEGFIILDARKLVNIDLLDKQYRAKDGWHPNAKAWEILLPELIKELNIN